MSALTWRSPYSEGMTAPETTQAISIHGGKPANGIDVSHWNGTSSEDVPDWVKFYGMKAVHIGGSKMEDGVDPLFEYNRARARYCGVPWRQMYLYLVADVPQVDQILKLAETVGDLENGECVMIDWEEHDVLTLDEEALYYLDSIYPDRWMVYVNDATPSMTAWMKANRQQNWVPLQHPNWSPEGWSEAKKWDASVWQLGVGYVPGYADCIDINLVTDPYRMDLVCNI